LFRGNSRVAPWHVALLAIVVPVVFYLIVKLAEFSLASLTEP
jgi:type VI protein secretion system component VasF